MEKKIRLWGVIGLIASFGTEPSLFGVIGSGVMTVISVVVVTYLLYLLSKIHDELTLFKMSITQTVVYSPVVIFLGYVATKQAELSSNSVLLYGVFAVLILTLLFLAVTNFMIGKRMRVLADKVDNAYFKISGILLQVSAYTMPILIGLFIFIVALVFFLIGCILYKDQPVSS